MDEYSRETQPLMMRLKSDLLEVMLAVAEGRLDKIDLKWDERPALCVVASSKGYPATTPPACNRSLSASVRKPATQLPMAPAVRSLHHVCPPQTTS